MLQGAIELDIDGEVLRLRRGDAVTFGATMPHTWRNTVGDERGPDRLGDRPRAARSARPGELLEAAHSF